MRQLVELHDHLAAFEALDADVVAIAQKEDDPARLQRVRALVGDGITFVCDPKGESSALSLFGTFLIDGEGRLRRAIPGIKQARARTDVILAQLAEMTGQPVPELHYEDGRTLVDGRAGEFSSDQVLSARWAFSHEQFERGGLTKLLFMPEIADGWHVYAPGSELLSPLVVSVQLPPGMHLAAPLRYPRPIEEHDELLEADVAYYQHEIPLDALQLELDQDFEQDEARLVIEVRWQACRDGTCLPPTSRRWELSLPVVDKGRPRGQLFGWQGW